MQPLRQLLLSLSAVFALGVVSGQAAAAPEDSHLLLYPGNTAVYINGSKTQTQVATLELNGRYYLPAAELTGWFGIPVKWDEGKQAVQITTPKAFLEYSLADRTVLDNGASRNWGTDADLQGDRLYLELTSLQPYISFQAKVDQELKRVELRYVKPERTGRCLRTTRRQTSSLLPSSPWTRNRTGSANRYNTAISATIRRERNSRTSIGSVMRVRFSRRACTRCLSR